jgi:hypothetical protein
MPKAKVRYVQQVRGVRLIRHLNGRFSAVGESKSASSQIADLTNYTEILSPELHMILNLSLHLFRIMKPIDEYKEAVANATAFKYDNPSKKQVTSARIYHINLNTLKSKFRRDQ